MSKRTMSLDVPVVLVIYNRPAFTQAVFAAIAEARPRTLLIVADGPRANDPLDAAKVAAARAITEAIDWPCEVLKDFASHNIGCRGRVSSGLDWVFRHVEQAIILEDDCLPSPGFFRFCRETLARYRDDQRIMAVAGTFPLRSYRSPDVSYFFSKWFFPWGWATWRRAWRHFNLNMTAWPVFRSSGAMEAFADTPAEAAFWSARFDNTYRGHVNSWYFPWQFACCRQSGLTVRASRNLVSNLGCGPDATHPVYGHHPLAALPLQDVHGLVHPPWVVRDKRTDMELFQHELTAEQDNARDEVHGPNRQSFQSTDFSQPEIDRLRRRIRYLEERVIGQHVELTKKEGVIRDLDRQRANRISTRLRAKIMSKMPRPVATQIKKWKSSILRRGAPRGHVGPPDVARLSHAPRIVLGAGGSNFAGWQSTDKSILDLRCRSDFARYWQPGTRDVFLAEHVWEHLTDEEGDAALRNCFEFLRPGGRLRLAVPDALHPDPAYQDWVRPGGTGPGADDHKTYYCYRTMAQKLAATGFDVTLLEYWDEAGRFHYRPWAFADGPIRRSSLHDDRNQVPSLRYTSLIVDATRSRRSPTALTAAVSPDSGREPWRQDKLPIERDDRRRSTGSTAAATRPAPTGRHF